MYKIKIHSPDHSEKVQKHLFSIGYTWTDSTTDLKHLDAVGIIFNGKFKEFFYMKSFNEWKDVLEVQLIENISYELKEVKKNVVKVGELSYYEDELAEALKNIKPIS
jgi:hypothetical protein